MENKEILDMIDVSRLSRNFFKFPFQRGENLTKKDAIYLYIELNLSIEEIGKLFSNYSYAKFQRVKEKFKLSKPRKMATESRNRTCLRKYGVSNISKSEYFKDLWKTNGKSWVDKHHENMKEKYGYISNFSNAEKMKEAYQRKLGVSNPAKLKSVVEKRKENQRKKFNGQLFFQTKECRIKCNNENSNEKRLLSLKKHETINISKPEKEIHQLLLTKFLDTISQYREERYPFNCDFYIPSLDVFIEYNGSWTHGFHPYNPNNPEDLSIVNQWKLMAKEKEKLNNKKSFYSQAIYTWTNLDVRKREIAIKNNLNYYVFYNKEQFMNWFNQI